MRTTTRLVGLSLFGALSCMTASPQAQRIRVTSSQAVVAGCKFLGNVEGSSGWDVGAIAANNATVEMRERAARLHANVVLLVSSGGHPIGEAYYCPEPAKAQAPRATAIPTPLPSPTPATDSTVSALVDVRIVSSEANVRGCVFVDSIDTTITCPAQYSSGNQCMAYRALKQGGNTVLEGAGKVYSCPAAPAK